MRCGAVEADQRANEKSQRGCFAAGQQPREQRLPILFANLHEGHLQPLQVGRSERLIGPQPVNHEMVAVAVEVAPNLILILGAGHFRHGDQLILPHVEHLVLEVRIDDLALLLVEERH